MCACNEANLGKDLGMVAELNLLVKTVFKLWSEVRVTS